jgi:hypothetical protein
MMLLLVQQHVDASRLLGRVKWQALVRLTAPPLSHYEVEGGSIGSGNTNHNT